MTATLDEVIDAVVALDIEGVNKNYGRNRPDALTGDLPASWVENPRIESSRMTFDVVNTLGGGFTAPNGLQFDLVVAIEQLGQNLNLPNFNESVDIMMAMEETLSQADIADSWPGQGSVQNIYLDHRSVGATWYWVVVATIQVTGG